MFVVILQCNATSKGSFYCCNQYRHCTPSITSPRCCCAALARSRREFTNCSIHCVSFVMRMFLAQCNTTSKGSCYCYNQYRRCIASIASPRCCCAALARPRREFTNCTMHCVSFVMRIFSHTGLCTPWYYFYVLVIILRLGTRLSGTWYTFVDISKLEF